VGARGLTLLDEVEDLLGELWAGEGKGFGICGGHGACGCGGTKGSLPLMETGLARPLDLGWKR
jgi:hypothetical protein